MKTGLTPRSLALGLILAFAVGAVGPYLSLYVKGSNSVAYFYSQIAHVVLFILIGVVNVVLGAARRSWRFDRNELVVLFILMSLANATPIVVCYWASLVASPYYYASAENNWEELILPHIPEGFVPDDLDAITAFYEGTPVGSRIDWQMWIDPVLSWLPGIVALHVAVLCLMVIVRRRWMEQERLVYPVMQLPLAMVQDDERGSLVKPFFRNGVMWIGFSVPVIAGAIIGLNAYYSYLPSLDLEIPIPYLKSKISFATIGFFFLIQREVAMGLWLFTLINNIQAQIYTSLGWAHEANPVIGVWSYGHHSLINQGFGAMIVLVLGGIWIGREHLGNVFRKAFGQAPEVEDGDEIMSYRAAVWGLLASLLVLVPWLVRIGIPLPGALVYLFFLLVLFVALTRVVAEGGVAVIYTPMAAVDGAVSSMGSAFYGSSGLVGLTFTRVLGNDLLNFVMPHCAHGLKLSGEISGRRRSLSWAMLLAILLGMAGALWMVFYLAYTYGLINMSRIWFTWLAEYCHNYTASRITGPSGANLHGWFHTGVGAVVMGLLMLARSYWGWWPLHPIGFPISSTFNWMAGNALLAWLIKGPVLRYGGVRFYRQVRPFFLGMIMGHFAIFGIFWIVDTFTGMVGNNLFL